MKSLTIVGSNVGPNYLLFLLDCLIINPLGQNQYLTAVLLELDALCLLHMYQNLGFIISVQILNTKLPSGPLLKFFESSILPVTAGFGE